MGSGGGPGGPAVSSVQNNVAEVPPLLEEALNMGLGCRTDCRPEGGWWWTQSWNRMEGAPWCRAALQAVSGLLTECSEVEGGLAGPLGT